MQYLVNILKLPQHYLEYTFWGNTINTYLLILSSLIVIFLIYKFGIIVASKHFKKVAEKTKSSFDDIAANLIVRLEWWVYLFISVYVVVSGLVLSESVSLWAKGIQFILGIYIVIRAINAIINQSVEYLVSSRDNSKQKFSVRALGNIGKVLVWVLGFVFMLSSYGYNISSLITGLGIGGIAVALAVQNVLSDILSSIAIHIDKPFRVGDFIQVGDQIGAVKYIGIKTTRLTSLTGEEIIISNNKLTSEDINNYGRLKRRRATQTIDVTYNTSLAKMKKIPIDMKKIISKVKDAEFDRCHFKTFGDSGKEFELVYYICTPDYLTYMDRRQEINFKIKEYYEKNKLEMAFPTQMIYHARA